MPKAAAKAPREVPSRRLGGDLSHLLAPQVALDTVSQESLLREDASRAAGSMTKVLRIGIGRDLVLGEPDGVWTELADGSRLWVADVVSPEAIGLRLRFADVRLPAGAELAVYGDGEPGRAEFFFGSAATKPTFWTGTVVGERAHVEYLAPAGSAEAGLPFRLDRLQHVYRDPVAHMAKAAGPCHNDVSCFPEWQGTANAVAGIGFVDGSDFLFCTGQLINNLKSDFTPFFLTANHCLSDPGEAGFVEFFWFYQTAGCGAPPPSLASSPRSEGASFVATNFQSDFTLIMVEGALPGGLTWAGWNAKLPADGTDAVAIHHPSGDFKRISFAFKGPVEECSTLPGRSLVKVNWTDAPTEPGSSGSGVFRADTGQLFGQLYGGPSSCGNESFDCYGNFASTYTRIKTHLVKGGSDDKSDQNDSCAKARKVKAGGLPGRIVKINDEDWYQITIKPGQILDVRLDFANASGDVDLAFYAACGQEPFTSSVSTEDSEFISVQNVGSKPAVARWRVFLANDTRNSYNQNVVVH